MNNIKFNKRNNSILTSFAVSGGCYFSIFDGSTLEIGDDTIWSYNVGIHTGNHDLNNRNLINVKDIKIGRNCWIGMGVVITQGVTLGDNVTVGANSIVTKSFPDNVVIAGNPAKIVKYLG